MENLIKQIFEIVIGWGIIIYITIKIVKKFRNKKDNKIHILNNENNYIKENEIIKQNNNTTLYQRKISEEVLKIGEPPKNYTSLYQKKEYLITTNEYKFYKLLKTICNRYNLDIFCQVSLYALVKTNEYKEFNKIKSKTIDYVITDNNCKIKLCIELDDPTHIREDRQERDKFINELFKQLNIKLLRIPVQGYYNLQYIEEKIKESL